MLQISLKSQNAWSFVGKFVKWHNEEPATHPIVDIASSIDKYLSANARVINLNVSEEHDDETTARLRECGGRIEQIVKELLSVGMLRRLHLDFTHEPCTPKSHFLTCPTDGPPLSELGLTFPRTPIEEQFEKRCTFVRSQEIGAVIMDGNHFETYDDELFLDDDNVSIMLRLLPLISFCLFVVVVNFRAFTFPQSTKDLVTPDAALIAAMLTEEAPVVEAPSPKKPRVELPQPIQVLCFRRGKINC